MLFILDMRLHCYLSAFSSFPLFIFQAKAKGQSVKVNINSALVEDIISLDEVKGDMTAVLNALKDDFTRNLSIRTSPGIQLISLSFLDCISCCLSPYIVLFVFQTLQQFTKLNSYQKGKKCMNTNLSHLKEDKRTDKS